MSNNAIRIIYNDLGRFSDDIVCERVFAPAPDFEALLKRRGLPLYTIESGIPLVQCDIVGFSIGYELLATNILTVLETGQIPLLVKERTENDPLVIAGGPASTNPHPFGAFLDAVYIGEAEAEFYTILCELAAMKKSGAKRIDFLDRLRASDA
ncbi:MAG: radical SAM protein, partial [Spirochaetales bacterium]